MIKTARFTAMFAALVTMMAANTSFAEPDINQHGLKGIKTVYVQLIDHVEDGCWKNPNKAKAAAERALKAAYVVIASHVLQADSTLTIGAIGYALFGGNPRNGCAISLNVELTKPFKVVDKDVGEGYISAGLLSITNLVTGRGDLSQQMSNMIYSTAQHIGLLIVKSK